MELVEYNLEIHDKLYKVNPVVFEKALLDEMKISDHYELKYHTIKCKVESLIQPRLTVVSSANGDFP